MQQARVQIAQRCPKASRIVQLTYTSPLIATPSFKGDEVVAASKPEVHFMNSGRDLAAFMGGTQGFRLSELLHSLVFRNFLTSKTTQTPKNETQPPIEDTQTQQDQTDGDNNDEYGWHKATATP